MRIRNIETEEDKAQKASLKVKKKEEKFLAEAIHQRLLSSGF